MQLLVRNLAADRKKRFSLFLALEAAIIVFRKKKRGGGLRSLKLEMWEGQASCMLRVVSAGALSCA